MTHPTRDELSWARKVLAAADVESPAVDAQWLLAHALGVDRGRLLVVDDIDDVARERFRESVDRRAQRIPLQHIMGGVVFGPVDLMVGPGVFTPRPETELLMQWAVDNIADGRCNVVDLCSGSGALGIAIAVLVPEARVTLVEISDDALIWLRRNVAASPAAERITVVQADVTDADAMRSAITPASVDVVLTNPPYVPTVSVVTPEVAHDPEIAVFGGADGMSVIGPMLPVIADLVRPGGLVGLEHDDATSDAVVEAFEGTGGFTDIVARADLAGRPRFVTARRSISLIE